MNTAVETKTKWAIDTTHSEVQFKIKHLVIANVTGTFKKFSGHVVSEDENFESAKAEFTIDVNSIDTNQPQRDAHLKSEDFFAAGTYGEIKFRNGRLMREDNGLVLVGYLTIRNVTKEVKLDVEYGGTVVDPYGNTKAGFELNGKINRKEFGLSWSAVTEAGGVVVGDDVKLHLNIELAKL